MTPDPLLDAIFQPGEESLHRVLKAARRRRIRRVLAPVAVSAACLAVAAHLLLSLQPPQDAVPARPVIQTIGSRPLSPRDVVHTSRASVEVVSTAEAAPPLATIADSELLASYQTGGAALVGVGEELRLIEF